MGQIYFVTGGARSGKSTFAEGLARHSGKAVVYVATMPASDDELRARIARHQADRPAEWNTVEAPDNLIAAIEGIEDGGTILVDCLSLWVANRLMASGDDEPTPQAVSALERSLGDEIEDVLRLTQRRNGLTIFVTNEVGGGVVPAYALGRAYRDLLGRVNQQASRAADRAWLLVSGRALELPASDPD